MNFEEYELQILNFEKHRFLFDITLKYKDEYYQKIISFYHRLFFYIKLFKTHLNKSFLKTCLDHFKTDIKEFSLIFQNSTILTKEEITKCFRELNFIAQTTLSLMNFIIAKHNYGYDFDGVFHKNVTNQDIYGIRHDTSENINNYQPNTKIINEIKQHIEDGENVFIITARFENDLLKIIEFLKLHFTEKEVDYFLNDKNTFRKIYFTDHLPKTENVLNLHLNYYFDDSCKFLMDIIESPEYQKLDSECKPKLFLVIPEQEIYYELNNKTHSLICTNFIHKN